MSNTIQLPPVDKIKVFFPYHRKCVVKVLVLLIQCMMRCRTVCLYKCRTEVGSVLGRKDLNLHNVYTQFIRFFKIKSIDAFSIGMSWLIIQLVGFEGRVYLVMDRSNWKIGKININVLFVGLLLPNGIFIPILWEQLDKRGNSNEGERMSLMKRFSKVWHNHSGIQITLLADREFIGVRWIGFLLSIKWSFVIRVRYGDYVSYVALALDKTIVQTQRLIERKVKRNGFFQACIELDGQPLYYTVFPNTGKRKNKKTKGDQFVILLSDFSDLQQISESYRKRWGIEVFFHHCKTNGFNLEDLNLKDLTKAQLMMGVVAVAYVLCIVNGLHCQKVKKIYLKNYNGKKAKAISLFRKGFDELKNRVHTMLDLIDFLVSNLRPLPDRFSYKLKLILKNV